MTTEEKAKRFDEVVEEFRGLLEGVHEDKCDIMEEDILKIVPELKRSEDERIRKELLEHCKNQAKPYIQTGNKCPQIQSWIAWLEKQDEQKPADKFEPKFKVGDWIVWKDKNYKVNYNACGYELFDQNGLSTSWAYKTIEDNAHLWSLKDAKDGDVLACNEEILLFKSYSVQNRISLYCWYNGQTNNFHDKEVTDTLVTTRNKICPATKEQRDLLFQKMHEAGYEWDAEKKEPKKIHVIDEGKAEMDYCSKMMNGEKVSPTWTEEDEKMVKDIIAAIDTLYYHGMVNWLKSIKDRVQPQPKQEWSDENKNIIDGIIEYLECFNDYDCGDEPYEEYYERFEKYIKFMESLKPQPQWKPSEEQMNELTCVISGCSYETPILIELLEQLKKL